MNAPAPSFAARLRAMPRQRLLLLALTPVLVAVWIPVASGRKRPAAAPPPAAAAFPAPAAETAAMAPADLPARAAALIARLRQLTSPHEPRWTTATGEPFRSALVPAPVDVITTAEPELAPSAIVLSRSASPVAIVQGRTCGIGDTVAGRTIVAIEERRVVYRDGDATFAVAMPAPTLGTRQ